MQPYKKFVEQQKKHDEKWNDIFSFSKKIFDFYLETESQYQDCDGRILLQNWKLFLTKLFSIWLWTKFKTNFDSQKTKTHKQKFELIKKTSEYYGGLFPPTIFIRHKKSFLQNLLSPTNRIITSICLQTINTLIRFLLQESIVGNRSGVKSDVGVIIILIFSFFCWIGIQFLWSVLW